MTDSDSRTRTGPDLKEGKSGAPDRPPAAHSSDMPGPVRMIATAIAAGLLAGLASWGIGESIVTAFRPTYQAQNVMGQTIMKATFQDQSAADTKNAALAFAVLGGTLGMFLGMAGGLIRRSGSTLVTPAVGGLALGAALGALASLALLPVYFRALERSQEELSRDLTLPLVVHGGIWAACGLAGGAAFGLGLGAGRNRTINAAIGGLIGAAVGAALFEMIGASIFPADRTTSPLATSWQARLVARLLVTMLSAWLAAVVINMRGVGSAAAKPLATSD